MNVSIAEMNMRLTVRTVQTIQNMFHYQSVL